MAPTSIPISCLDCFINQDNSIGEYERERRRAFANVVSAKEIVADLFPFPCLILQAKKIKSRAFFEKVDQLLMLLEEKPTLLETELLINQLNEKPQSFEVTVENILQSDSYLMSTMLRMRKGQLDPQMFEKEVLEILQVQEILEKINLIDAEMKRYLDKTEICNMRDDVTRYLDGQRPRQVVRNLLQATDELKDGLTVFFEIAVETKVLIEDLGFLLTFLDDRANKSPDRVRTFFSKLYALQSQTFIHHGMDWEVHANILSLDKELFGDDTEGVFIQSMSEESFGDDTEVVQFQSMSYRPESASPSFESIVNSIFDAENAIRKDIFDALWVVFNAKRLVMEINDQTLGEKGIPSGMFPGKFCGGLRFKREAKKINGQKLGMEDSKLESTSPWCSPQGNSNQKDIAAGLEGMLKITARLVQTGPSGLEVLTIVGMAGIGKSTLATLVFHNPITSSHFACRAWATVREDCEVKELLYGLLCSISLPSYEKDERNTTDIAKHLNSCLKGRRYLIVMDNMLSVEAWDAVRQFLPDDKNESRILLTTRSMQLATSANPNNTNYCMNLLDEYQSWEFLKKKLFGIRSCPPELLDIGKQIAKKCLGLPSAIAYVANLLSRTMTHDWWMVIENRLNSLVCCNPEEYREILSLEFEHLLP